MFSELGKEGASKDFFFFLKSPDVFLNTALYCILYTTLQDCFPDFATCSPPVADLQAFYKESKKRFDEDEAFKKRAYEAVVKLQAHDPVHIKGWEEICVISKKEFEKVRQYNLYISGDSYSVLFTKMKVVICVSSYEDEGISFTCLLNSQPKIYK